LESEDIAMDAQQIEFIRRHGVKRLPPGPMIPMSWHSTSEQSEQERISEASRGGHAIPGIVIDAEAAAEPSSCRDGQRSSAKQRSKSGFNPHFAPRKCRVAEA
jgi:hypothetical protein